MAKASSVSIFGLFAASVLFSHPCPLSHFLSSFIISHCLHGTFHSLFSLFLLLCLTALAAALTPLVLLPPLLPLPPSCCFCCLLYRLLVLPTCPIPQMIKIKQREIKCETNKHPTLKTNKTKFLIGSNVATRNQESADSEEDLNSLLM